jgi:OOP family OmpA-OmpF porin
MWRLLWLGFLLAQKQVIPAISSPRHESAPVPSADGRRLFFWRLDDPIGLGAQDIFLSLWDDSLGAYGPSQHLSGGINDHRGNIPFGITPDGQYLLVYKEFRNPHNPCELGLSRRLSETIWTAPAQLKIKNFHSESGSSLTASLGWDARTLLLSMRGPDSRGGEDLYVSFYDPEQRVWSEPLSLGPTINTSADEITPYLAPDGITLYFSTNGRKDSEGFDVYMTRRLDDTWQRWSVPVRLPAPINSPADDYYFRTPALRPDLAFFVSTDSLEKLGREIYTATLPPAFLPKPVVLISGRVIEHRTQKPVGGQEIRYYDLLEKNLVGTAYADPETGSYKIILPAGTLYAIVVVGSAYFSISEQIDLRDINRYRQITQDLRVVPLVVGERVPLYGLYFEVGDSTLRPESQIELERLVWLLSEKPTLQIEVVGHTDSTGSAALNERLSWGRARAVVSYLVGRGIASERLRVRGAGAAEPIASNATPEGRAQNRRVEIRLITL